MSCSWTEQTTLPGEPVSFNDDDGRGDTRPHDPGCDCISCGIPAKMRREEDAREALRMGLCLACGRDTRGRYMLDHHRCKCLHPVTTLAQGGY